MQPTWTSGHPLNNKAFAKSADIEASYRDLQDKPPDLEHYHDSYELALFIKANMDLFVKDLRHSIADGDMLFVKPYDVHRMVYSHQHYERYVIQFKKEYVRPLLEAVARPGLIEEIEAAPVQKINLPMNVRLQIEGYFRKVVAAYNQSAASGDPSEHPVMKLNLALLLVEFHRLAQSAGERRKISVKEQTVRKLIHYIDEQYAEPLSLSALAHEFHLNKCYLSHLFKEITQFTIVEYIHYRRVIEAQKMLTGTTRPITDICLQCGFDNVQHFYKVFKKIAKTSPHKYRFDKQI